MADLIAAETAHEEAVTRKTHDVQARAWRRWKLYTESIGCDDPFLDGLDKASKIKLMGAFAMALREGRYSRRAHDTLVEATIRNTISYVAQTFREEGRPNPTRDDDGELGRLLSRLYRSFRNRDPAEKQQKAIPLCVLKELANLRSTEKQKAVYQLSLGAFFFAMRSCEYVEVKDYSSRRTKRLCLRNLCFRRDGAVLPHDDPNLHLADTISILFEKQKKEERNDEITQHSSGETLLNPTRLWAAITKRIRSYPGANDDTPVSAVWRNNRIEHITADDIINAIDAAADSIGYERLGLQKGDLGTHSIRSGAAMAMYLDEVPIYTIMMLGRWSSDAFLRYIRKQVEQFSHNISKRMIKHQEFRHIPLRA